MAFLIFQSIYHSLIIQVVHTLKRYKFLSYFNFSLAVFLTKAKSIFNFTMNDYHHFKFTPSVWLVPLLLLILIWFVFFLEHSFNIDLTSHGILPRTVSGLQGVLFSPFLHGSLNHIANNSIPLFILTTALIYFYRAISFVEVEVEVCFSLIVVCWSLIVIRCSLIVI